MNGKRNTIQRRAIFDAVRELDIHATAEQVYEYVVKKHPTISRATVYRNLSQMSDAGELLNIGSFHGSAHYDHNCRTHYHFVCDGCRRVFDVDACFGEMFSGIPDLEGFEIKSQNLSFGGLCADCKKQSGERSGKNDQNSGIHIAAGSAV